MRWVCVVQGGWTALTWASYKGRVDVATVLLEAGANPNTTGQVKLAYGISTYRSYEIKNESKKCQFNKCNH